MEGQRHITLQGSIEETSSGQKQTFYTSKHLFPPKYPPKKTSNHQKTPISSRFFKFFRPVLQYQSTSWKEKHQTYLHFFSNFIFLEIQDITLPFPSEVPSFGYLCILISILQTSSHLTQNAMAFEPKRQGVLHKIPRRFIYWILMLFCVYLYYR